MSDADVIRRAADMLRGLAEHATDGEWSTVTPSGRGIVANPYDSMCMAYTTLAADADYIARMHPGVGRALAEWLDFEAEHDCCEPSALTVARAILGEQS